MRLIRKKIYRAFPELDRFDDERCVRFAEAARGGFWSKLSAITVCVMASLLTFVIPIIIADLINPPIASAALGAVSLMIVVAGCIATPLVALLVRDQLLRLRVRYVLHYRGICLGCKYALIGLKTDSNGMVICPECQRRGELDEAFAALEGDGADQLQVRDAGRRRRTIWLLMMVQHTLAAATWCAVVLPALAGLTIEGLIALQPWRIRTLLASLPTASELSERVVAGTGTDLWDVYDSTVLRTFPPPEQVEGSFDVIRFNPRVAMSAEPAVRLSAYQRDQLAAARTDGRVAALALMSRCVPRFVPESKTRGADDTRSVSEHIMNLIRHAWVNESRMYAAIESEDAQEFTNAVQTGLLIATALEARGRDGAWDHGKRIEYTTHAAVLAAMETPLSTHIAPLLVDVYARLPLSPPTDHVWVARRADSLEAICNRMATMPPRWSDYLAGKTRLGAATNPIEDFTRLATNYAAQPMVHRSLLEPLKQPNDFPHFSLGGSFSDAPGQCLDSESLTALQCAGIRMWLALEKFHRQHGEYPSSLAELDAGVVRIDPWTATPFGYRRIEGVQKFEAFDSTPGFLLYSRGSDDRDDLLDTSASLPPVRMLPRAGRFDPSRGLPILTGPRDILINATN